MGFLFSHRKVSGPPELTGLQIQTAVNVLPIPIVYGAPRIPMNVIYVNGFKAVAQKQSGGKGLLSGGKSGGTTGYKYFATFIGAFCEGTVGQLIVIFDDQQTYTPTTAPPGKVFQLFTGTPTQVPWTVVSGTWPSDAFAYKDTAYCGFYNWPLDSTATIPQLNVVLQGVFTATSPLNLYTAPNATTWFLDADPAQCILDFLTNATYGAGFPSSLIDTTTLLTGSGGLNPAVGDAALSTYCQAVGLAWSVVINNAEPASSILERWCKNLVVAPVWTGYSLKFIPYYDSFIGTNPGWNSGAGIPLKYYAPNIPVLVDLTDDDFIQTSQGDDPLIATRSDVIDVKNTVRIDFRDRYNLFNDNVSEAKDENLIDVVGPRIDRVGTADEFSFLGYASLSAQLQLQRNVAIRNTYSFKLGMRFCWLDPMDIVTITDATLGLSKFAVRIRSIEEDEKGILTILAEEFPAGAASATVFAHQTNTPPTSLQFNLVPPLVNTPIIFEPTNLMLTAESEPVPVVAIAVSGGPLGTFDPNWGGCFIWVSDDNVTYVQLPQVQIGPSRMGLTTSGLTSYAGGNPQVGSTLGVDLRESNSTLENFTAAQAASGLSLCAIADPTTGEFELIGYETATLTGPNQYTLSPIYRGLYGTVACTKVSGLQFCRVDDLVTQAPLPTGFIGKQIWVKLPSFNIFGLETQDISTVVAYTYTPTGAGISNADNPLVITLLAGLNADLDLRADPVWDLSLGGAGSCGVAGVTVDLQAL